MKLVILEGADFAGKSTAFNSLQKKFENDERFSFMYVGPAKQWPENTSPFEYWKNRLRDAFQKMHRHYPHTEYVVFDRSFLGNYVYGKIKGDQPTPSILDLERLFGWLSTIFTSVSVVLLQTSKEELEKRMGQREEDYVTKDEIWEASQIYKDLIFNLSGRDLPCKFLLMEKDKPADKTLNQLLTLFK